MAGNATATPPAPAAFGNAAAADGWIVEAGHARRVGARELHLRLPARLVPMPGAPLDLLELEDWIVGAFCVTYQRMHQGSPPPLSHAASLSGRSERRVMAAWKRMAKKGWLGMAKVPHQYGAGQFGYRWRVWFPQGSPLLALLEQRRGSTVERWIAVPQDVARNRSVLPTAMYLLAHEQRMIDGAVTLKPGEAASILNCDRNTARRLLRDTLAATAIEVSPGCTIYDISVVFEGKGAQTVQVAGLDVLVYGDRGVRLLERVRVLADTLNVHGTDGKAAFRRAYEDVVGPGWGDATPRLDLIVRLLEERHRAILTRNPWYRHQLTLRLSSRLRTLLTRPKAARRVARIEPEAPTMDGHALRMAIASALTASCRTCEDTRIAIDRDTGLGHACPDCASG